jgi:hypothetical protein
MIRHGPPRSTVLPLALRPMERCVPIPDLCMTPGASPCETIICYGFNQPEISLIDPLSKPTEPKHRPARTTPKPFCP